MHAAQPAETQARQQTSAAAADRDRNSPNLELDQADQHADQHADAEEDEIGDCRGGDLIADLGLHPVEVGRTAGEVQFVAALQLELVEHRQIEPHALDCRQEYAVTGVNIRIVVDLTDFAAVQCAVGQNDFAVFLNQHQTVRGGNLSTEECGSGLQDFCRAGDRDAIASLNDRRVGKLERLALAVNGFDRGIGKLFVDRQC